MKSSIGDGQYGKVFKGISTITKEDLAIKVIMKDGGILSIILVQVTEAEKNAILKEIKMIQSI